MSNEIRNQNFFDNLVKFFREHHAEEAESLVTFARRLFKLAPARELDLEPITDLGGLVLSLRRYMDSLAGTDPKVKSFNPNLEEDGWEHRYTQIFILQRDMAFLVDSMRMALNRRGLAIHSINSTMWREAGQGSYSGSPASLSRVATGKR